MEQNIKDYLPFYIGCKMETTDVFGKVKIRTLSAIIGDKAIYDCNDTDEISMASSWDMNYKNDPDKPFLRPLSDMTEEEAEHFAWLCMDSKHHLEKDWRISKKEVSPVELAKWDNGLMLDKDIEIYIGVSIRCFEGSVAIKRDGSICMYDADGKLEPVDDVASKVKYLLSKHFDLFGLIEAGLAIDATTLKTKED